MITNLMILIITLHWSYALGHMIALRTNLTIGQFLMACFLIRYTLYSYGI